MSTYIDGVGSSEAIDSSSERVIISGLDISSLVGSVFNYEHQNDEGASIVGKILKAKKIFSEKDCEDERQLYYWNKCGLPFLYVMGELFDDYKDAAKEVAGLFHYDHDHRGATPMDTVGFSVEGSKLSKEGNDITRSIARKISITITPCNKTAIAEMVPTQEPKKDDFDDIFKTEHTTEIRIFPNLSKSLKKDPAAPSAKMAPPAPKTPSLNTVSKTPNQTKLGTTNSGKDVFSHQPVGDYKGFTSQDHRDAANLHNKAAQAAKDPTTGKHHNDKSMLHSSASNTAMDREKRTGMNKAMAAGSGMSAPGSLTQGAALAAEEFSQAPKSGNSISKNLKKKSKWFIKAEELYNSWDKKKEFQVFMQKKLPSLALGEIDALGKTMLLKNSLNKAPKENPFSEFEQGEVGSYIEKTSKADSNK